ncbi:E3 ubiquitin- ligase RHF2A-like [Olea europaea subsp. europaea]|uniref:RING-type E3 ubiquitin transferase n=1 Tax=Olea europaea subsp. europaea TaxID=158383 RepID=A0A8S0UKZ3_OLEEU|nr:E3 ubiquitin- ligase RHF2A-like [Olea europaea subsp. europaea]
MEDEKVPENHLSSAAAFVEGGIQEACDDACSICLEDFSDSDPSTVTNCKHEFHLQCILEWCQRSSQCPMCWQTISLKDPNWYTNLAFLLFKFLVILLVEGPCYALFDSQELLDAVEHERNLRMNPPRNTTIFHHPTLGDFELQHLPVSASDSELEERIIQHLAAAAAMGRTRQLGRREGHRSRSSTQGRPHFLVFSTNPNSSSSSASSPAHRGGVGTPPAVMIDGPNSPFITVEDDSAQLTTQPSPAQVDQVTAPTSGSIAVANQPGTSSSNRSPAQTSPNSQDRAGPSDLQSFSDSLKSRLGALSTRYKESITKSTRGWKERLFARNSSTPDPSTEVRSSTPDPSTEVRRDVDPDIAPVSRMMDHLEIAEDSGTNIASVSNDMEDSSTPVPAEQHNLEMGGNPSLTEDNAQAPCTSSTAAT